MGALVRRRGHRRHNFRRPVLGFLGNTQYPIWSLTMVALNIIVLFALTARWDESKDGLTNR